MLYKSSSTFLFSLEEFPVDDNCAIEKDIKMGHYNEIDKKTGKCNNEIDEKTGNYNET